MEKKGEERWCKRDPQGKKGPLKKANDIHGKTPL
jgi:hypothetical protein